MADFIQAYTKTVVGNEGGYRNVSWDAETYRGINRTAHPNWSGWHVLDQRKPIPFGKVYADLEPTVQSFYRDNFWNKMLGAYIQSQSIANLIFDYYVQSGGFAIKKIQQAVNTVVQNKVAEDGIMGNQTLGAINSAPAVKINNAILDARKAHYENLLQAGVLSTNDWQGILNRLNSFPYLKETLIGGAAVLMLIGLGLIFYTNK